MFYKLLEFKMSKFEIYMNAFDTVNKGKYYEILSIINCEKKKGNKIIYYINVCIRSTEELIDIIEEDSEDERC